MLELDTGYLAQFYANGLLTTVQLPDEVQEQDRDLLRLRLLEGLNQILTDVWSADQSAGELATLPRGWSIADLL